MKLNFYLSPDDPVRIELEGMGVEFDPSSEYIISRRAPSANYLQAKKDSSIFFLDVNDVVFVESMGHDVLIHTRDGIFNSPERLKGLEQILDNAKFLRVSNCAIVNLKQVKRIEASILQKFVLHMSDGSKVDVTRTYYYIFKDRLGI